MNAQLIPAGLIARLDELSAPQRVPGKSEYEFACAQAAAALRAQYQYIVEIEAAMVPFAHAFIQGSKYRRIAVEGGLGAMEARDLFIHGAKQHLCIDDFQKAAKVFTK